MTDNRRFIIDCDPGVDDTIALAMALKRLNVLGITTVGGNVGLENTCNNALFVAETLGYASVPVFAGYDMPLVAKPTRAEEVHGKSGLGGLEELRPCKKREKLHAVDYIIETFMNETDVSLITLGPLTNIAHAILREPELKNRIPDILCMGGSVTAGNYNAVAEFNIYVDPEAAKIVFESGIPIKMAGLNLCRQNSMTKEDVGSIRAVGNKVSELMADLIDFSIDGLHRAEICDAVTVAWYIDSNIIKKSLPMNVKIETGGEFTRGMTVCDYRNYQGLEPKEDIGRKRYMNYETGKENCEVAMELDQQLFKQTLIDILREY